MNNYTTESVKQQPSDIDSSSSNSKINPLQRFISDIIRPWEELNVLLSKQYLIDPAVSDIIRVAGSLSIAIKHFLEVLGRKGISAGEEAQSYNIISDVADGYKHGALRDNSRNNDLITSSLFEGNEEGKFRFIRNKVTIKHNRYGDLDFLEVSKQAVLFFIKRLNLNIFWNPPILENPNPFHGEVFLYLHHEHQVALTGLQLQIEFLKRNQLGELVHYDPPSWKFSLISPTAKTDGTYLDYLTQLFKKSVSEDSVVESKAFLPVLNSPSGTTRECDITIRRQNSLTIVKVLDENTQHQDIDFEDLKRYLEEVGAQHLICVSREEFSEKIKAKAIQSSNTVQLVTIKSSTAESIPLGFFNIKIRHLHIKLTALHKVVFKISKEDEAAFGSLRAKTLKDIDNKFSLDKKSLMSFRLICLEMLNTEETQDKGRTLLKHDTRDEPLIYYKTDEVFVKVGFEVDLEWAKETVELPVSVLSYERNDSGADVWIIDICKESTGGKFGWKMPPAKFGNTAAFGILGLSQS